MKHSHITIFAALILITLSLFLGSTYYWYSPLYPSVIKAIALIHPTHNHTVSGIVTFEQKLNGVHVHVVLQGLTPGEHGLHIHELGDCSHRDAKCAGGHFNPTGKSHGAPSVKDHHLGDMGNIVADAQGNAVYAYVDHTLQLNGALSIIGRAVVVHEKRDDFITQPTGASGDCAGCGVIGIARKA